MFSFLKSIRYHAEHYPLIGISFTVSIIKLSVLIAIFSKNQAKNRHSSLLSLQS
jgi:hypothetical protein